MFASMVIPGYGTAAHTHQKIKIGTLVSLQHVINVELPIARAHGGWWLLPLRQTCGQLFVADMQMQFAIRHIQLHDVTALHDGQWPTG